MPYFSTSLKPGVVLRVPARVPFQPWERRVWTRDDVLFTFSNALEKRKGGEVGDGLGGYSRTAGEDVQSYAFTEQDLAHWAADGGALFDGSDALAF